MAEKKWKIFLFGSREHKTLCHKGLLDGNRRSGVNRTQLIREAVLAYLCLSTQQQTTFICRLLEDRDRFFSISVLQKELRH